VRYVRQTIVKKISNSLKWLQNASKYEIDLIRQIDKHNLYNDELQEIEKEFNAFDIRDSVDGRITFQELHKICDESEISIDQSLLRKVCQEKLQFAQDDDGLD
jgi:Ca2+-binding EF-hand superfamily protein